MSSALLRSESFVDHPWWLLARRVDIGSGGPGSGVLAFSGALRPRNVNETERHLRFCRADCTVEVGSMPKQIEGDPNQGILWPVFADLFDGRQ